MSQRLYNTAISWEQGPSGLARQKSSSEYLTKLHISFSASPGRLLWSHYKSGLPMFIYQFTKPTEMESMGFQVKRGPFVSFFFLIQQIFE